MTPFRYAYRDHQPSIPPGPRKVYAALYRAFWRIERIAGWLRVKTWKMSVGERS